MHSFASRLRRVVRPWILLLAVLTVAAGAATGVFGGSGSGFNERTVVPDPPFKRIAGRPTGPDAGKITWQRRLEGPVVPGPVEGRDGSVLAASNGGVLHALDPATGRDRWTFDGKEGYGLDLSTSPAVLPDGTVLWPGPRSRLFALDGATGELEWEADLPAMPLTPAVSGDRVYVQDDSGTLTALDRQGRRKWALKLGDTSYSSPAIGPDGTVYAAADDTVFAVRDGEIAWQVRTGSLIEVSPAVASDGTVTIGSNDKHQYGISPCGRVRWRYRIRVWTYSSAAVTPDGLIYFGDHLGLVNALDARTGKLRYRVLGRGKSRYVRAVGVWTRPAVDARHAVYFGTRLGHVHGFDARGERLFDLDLGDETIDSYPTITRDGVLVIGSESGKLTAIGE